MSSVLPGALGVMFPPFSLPMKAERSRNKERLEASLAGLCELELLKQRQECRVLSALCLGDAASSSSSAAAAASASPARLPWAALRSARCALDTASDECGLALQTASLQCTPWNIKLSLEQQVAELKVNTEVKSAESPTDSEDKQFSAGDVLVTRPNGSPESNYHPVVPRSLSSPETETGESWLSDPMRPAAVADAFGEVKNVDPGQQDYPETQKAETYICGLIQRRALPTRPSKPRTSLAHDTRAINVVRQSSLCRKEEQYSLKQVSVQDVCFGVSKCSEGTPPPACHNMDQESEFNEASPPYHHFQQSVQHQPEFYHKPRQAPMVSTPQPTLPDYPSCSAQGHQDSSNSEPESPQHFHSYHSRPGPLKPHHPPSPGEQLVSAEYIPAQPCRASTRAYAQQHSGPQKGPGPPKPGRSAFSPERGHHHEEQQPAASQLHPSRCRGGPKKCRLSEERTGASRKQGKKACRSQSENSLQRVPERKYNTVERDGGGSGSGGRGSRSSQSRSRKQQQQQQQQQGGGGGYRRWQSSLELSQDEAEPPPTQASHQRDGSARRTRKSRATQASYAYPHRAHHPHPQHHPHHHHMEYHLEREHAPLCKPGEDYPHPGQGESESSMSEADSPDSSSLSSDSDESGGLVWPQQLPPQLSLPSPASPPGAPLQPKAFVKIKASHALKKKILRFRTGSLKVMTTV